MNWIIKSKKNLYCHTNLNNLLNSSWIDISEFNWVMSDLDVINYSKEKLPIDFRENYSILTAENFRKIIETNIQIIWGIISAVKKSEMPKFDKENFPYAEGNENVWKSNYFQIENSVFEITAWDSSYTIVKFRNQDLSEKFKNHFDEATELKKYKF